MVVQTLPILSWVVSAQPSVCHCMTDTSIVAVSLRLNKRCTFSGVDSTDIPVRLTRCLDHQLHFTQRSLAELQDTCKQTKLQVQNRGEGPVHWVAWSFSASCLSVAGRGGWATRVRSSCWLGLKTHRRVEFLRFLRMWFVSTSCQF